MGVKTRWELCLFQVAPCTLSHFRRMGVFVFWIERDWSRKSCFGNTIEGVILFLLWCTFMVPSFKNTALRAAAWKTQTSPDSSKKSSSILFHKRNPYLEQFSKMKFKRFSEFHFSRNRAMSAFAQMGLAAKPKIGKFCECWAASQSKIRKEIETLFYIK